MDVMLRKYKTYVEDRLIQGLSPKERADLYRYHIDRVRDFQHERLIHLVVTLFFGLLLIASVTALLLVTLPELRLPLGVLGAILFVLELAYIRHYYQLENGVQALYSVTEKLRPE